MNVDEILGASNVAELLDDSKLAEIGRRVCKEYTEDDRTMADWKAANMKALEVVRQVHNEKSEPWQGAANTYLPLVLNAATKFHSEAYGELISDNLVKCEVLGPVTPEKTARAERVSSRMDYELFHRMENWEDGHDKLILSYSIIGCVHKKLTYDRNGNRISSTVLYDNFVVNDSAESLDRAPRQTHRMEFFGWEVEERFRSGDWMRVELQKGENGEYSESDRARWFLEQKRREDLDGDGYPEPYVVTVDEKTQKVVRILADYTEDSVFYDAVQSFTRVQEMATGLKSDEAVTPSIRKIEPGQRVRYVKYEFIPAFDGGYWSYGWGRLLGPLNDNCNALVNQLLDAGTLANRQGGFISQQLRSKKGDMRFKPGEWKWVNATGFTLKDAVLPLPVREPSGTLFSLLGLLIETLKELSSVTAVMSGEQPRANMAAASVIALIDQGKKTFSAIYKRHWRSLKNEFGAVFDLLREREDPQFYQAFVEVPADPRQDFSRDGVDIIPVASPVFSSRAQRMAEAEALLPLSNDPRVNGTEILRTFVMGVTDDVKRTEAIVPAEPIMTPERVAQQIEIELQKFRADTEARALEAKAQEAEVSLEIRLVELEKSRETVGPDIIRAVESAKASIQKTRKAEADAQKAENAPSTV